MGSIPPSSRLTVYGFLERKLFASSPRTKLATAEGPRWVSLRMEYSLIFAWMYSANCTTNGQSRIDDLGPHSATPVSPASPENAINVWLFNSLVLSSVALRIVAPRMAALEAAMMVKSLPVIPSKTSLEAFVSIDTKARLGVMRVHCEQVQNISRSDERMRERESAAGSENGGRMESFKCTFLRKVR